MNDGESKRNKYVIKLIERKITDDKKDIAGNVALASASALAIGIGALGAAYFGTDIIKAFSSSESLTLSSYLSVRFQSAGVAVSAVAVIAGIYGVIKNAKGTIASVRSLEHDKNYLKELKEEDERVR